MDEIIVDDYGYVYVGGLKVFRLAVGDLVEFFDRNKRRSEKRGSSFVYVTPAQLCKFLESIGGDNEPKT
jgi:hypothetical protein